VTEEDFFRLSLSGFEGQAGRDVIGEAIKWGLSRLHTDKADAQHLRLLLRARRKRQRNYRAADETDELAPRDVNCHPLPSSRGRDQ
jgi:hypothetical protein